ncbi:hypothetical protein ABTC25_18405, partial [Acinetobacter baumannii]
TLQTQPPMVADELRRQADQFVDIADLEQLICRDPAQQRPVRDREPATRSYAPRSGGTGAGNHLEQSYHDTEEV